jgi:hypothetical protein
LPSITSGVGLISVSWRETTLQMMYKTRKCLTRVSPDCFSVYTYTHTHLLTHTHTHTHTYTHTSYGRDLRGASRLLHRTQEEYCCLYASPLTIHHTNTRKHTHTHTHRHTPRVYTTIHTHRLHELRYWAVECKLPIRLVTKYEGVMMMMMMMMMMTR